MSKFEGFKVEIESDFEEFWCYNVAVTCGCFDAADNRVGFASADDKVAPVGANLQQPPKGTPSKRRVEFETMACHHLLMYIYIIPHTLPAGNEIAEYKPFEMSVRVTREGSAVLKRTFTVNRWSGASIELKAGE